MSKRISDTKDSRCSKHRKTSYDDMVLQLTDLPVEALISVADYLPKPAIALFATALTAPSESWESNWWQQPSTLTKAIVESPVGDGWEELDFACLDESLAEKLSDEDLDAVLVCTDAIHKLKRLKLAGCINITGSGLDSLMGSSVLEQIDLTMTKEFENSIMKTRTLICGDEVLPIIWSIIDADGSSLKQMQIPRKLLLRDYETDLDYFLLEYCQLLQSRPFNCAGSRCPAECPGQDGNGLLRWSNRGSLYDWSCWRQHCTCYSCLQNFCTNSSEYSSSNNSDVSFCCICERNYCRYCVRSEKCTTCYASFCTGCVKRTECEKCLEFICDGCSSTCDHCSRKACFDCDPMFWCMNNGCTKTHCNHCTDKDTDYVQACEMCDKSYCFDCRLEKVKNDEGRKGCSDCRKMVLDEDGNVCPENHNRNKFYGYI